MNLYTRACKWRETITVEKRVLSRFPVEASPISRARFRVVFSFTAVPLSSAESEDKQAIDRGDERLSVSGVRRSIPQCSGRNASFVARRFMRRSCASERVNFQKQASVFRSIRHDGSRWSDGGGRAGSLIAVRFHVIDSIRDGRSP